MEIHGKFQYGELLYGGWTVEFVPNAPGAESFRVAEYLSEGEAKMMCDQLNDALRVVGQINPQPRGALK